jgi:DNA polymerase I-like protein with 3'-5' exonuclease and polymerase domains
MKGTPFSKYNRLVVTGWRCLWKDEGFKHFYTGESEDDFYNDLVGCSHVVGFNLKFDLHWIRVLGDRFAEVFQTKRLWDCQLAEYVLSRQRWVYPSLDGAMERRGGPRKIDRIKLEYWDKGINTCDIPRNELTEYLQQDVESTTWLFLAQQKDFQSSPLMFRVFCLSCEDLKVLEEMEYNGIKIDTELCHARAVEVRARLADFHEQLRVYNQGIDVNWDSGDHLSAVLFGGYVPVTEQEQIGIYKTGAKAGQRKYRTVENLIHFPRLFEPQDEWEVKKTKDKPTYELQEEGKWRIYFTNDEVLSTLKDKIGIVEILKARAKWTKILEYYVKLPKLVEEKGWEPSMLHGQFNQVVTRTGRASSSDPNLQNFAGEIQDVFITRY